MATLTEIRSQFEHLPDCRLVSPDIYIKHLTAHHQWVRSDEPSANLLGLLDESTGNRILVPVEELTQCRVDSYRRKW